MKRVREGEEEEIPLAFLEILESNLYHTFLSLDDFIVWHSTCRFLRSFLREGFLGKYTQQFCRIALEKNDHLLKTKKHGSFYLSIKRLTFLRQIQEAVDSIMGPIVFNIAQMEKGGMISCTLEAIGYKPDSTLPDQKKLYHILEKSTSYIKEVYGWDVGIKRGTKRYQIPPCWNYDHLVYTDQCVLYFKEPEVKSPEKKIIIETRESGCIIF